MFMREDMPEVTAIVAPSTVPSYKLSSCAARPRQGALRGRDGRDVRRADARRGRGPREKVELDSRSCRFSSMRRQRAPERVRVHEEWDDNCLPHAAARQRLRGQVEAAPTSWSSARSSCRARRWCRWKARRSSPTGTTAPTSSSLYTSTQVPHIIRIGLAGSSASTRDGARDLARCRRRLRLQVHRCSRKSSASRGSR